MTKKEIAEEIYDRLIKDYNVKIRKKEVYNLVSEVFTIIQECLLRGEKVKISGFGTFIVKTRKPKKGMNIKKREIVEVPERKIVLFKPSKNFIKL
ncbi:MAG: DNA-binding protein [Aquifex sp.]|nr:MAG: DNA-binding protein [Aquifex sp.]